ncbi:MAG: carboxypeptidase regulatory-like domain-containing protein, partial [Planctomycetota bacterium]
MRAIVVCSLILVSLLACLAWWFAADDEVISPDAVRRETAATQRAANLAAEGVATSSTKPAAPGDGSTRTAVEATLKSVGAADAPVGLTGRVVDEHGSPIEKAVVMATPANWYEGFDSGELDIGDPAKVRERVQAVLGRRRSIETDADGKFRLAVAGPAKQIELRVRARGRVAVHRNVERPAKVDVDLGNLTLALGAVVAGRVVDPSGQPVAAARVSRVDKDEGYWGYDFESPGSDAYRDLQAGDEAVTDDDGAFELPNVPAGGFGLRVWHHLHPPARRDGLTVAAGASLSDVVVVLDHGATISGRVTGAPTGERLHAMAAMRPDEATKDGTSSFLTEMFASDTAPPYGQRTAPVDAAGNFVLTGLAVGKSYRVWAVQMMRDRAGPATCAAAIDTTSGSRGITLRYDSGVTITARLVDERTGASIEAAWVRRQLVGGDPNANREFDYFDQHSNAPLPCPDGHLTLPNLRPRPKQTLTLAVEAIGYTAWTRENIALPTTGPHDLGTVRLAPRPVVRVLVTAAGQPLVGATVQLQAVQLQEGNPDRTRGKPSSPAPLTAKTDDQGRCTINSRGGVEVRVYATATELAPFASDALTLPEDEDFEFHAQLVQGGVVHVTAQDADGVIAAGVSVRHRPPNGGTTNKKADASGRVTFAQLAPGQHRFQISAGRSAEEFGMPGTRSAAADEPGWQSLDVTDGSVQALALEQQPQASLSGVVRENGLPLAGARVGFVRGTSAASDPNAQRQEMMMRQFEGSAGAVVTDDAGHYELKGLPAGEHGLQVTHENRVMPASAPVSLRIGDNIADVDLSTAIVRGTVRDPAGKPIAEASVSITTSAPNGAPGRSRSGKTDPDGRYELRGVQNDTDLILRARAKGFAESTAVTVRVAAGAAREDVGITLAAAGRIEVRTAAEGRLRLSARREGADAKDPRPPSASATVN